MSIEVKGGSKNNSMTDLTFGSADKLMSCREKESVFKVLLVW